MKKIEEDFPDIKVLIVDDNPNNIVAMKNILSELPISISTASSGEEALKIVLRHQYALIYLDVQMPEMDGFEVAKCLTQNKTTSNIPIIFVTAIHRDESNFLEGYESGAIDYLTKPINPQILISKTKIFIRLYEQQQKLELAVRQLDELANCDSLTGLANRNQFNAVSMKLLDNSKRYDRKFALLLLDLDDFKLINDNFGHDVGDAFLKIIAKRLEEALRISDLVARLGGDEFVILLSDLNSVSDAGHIAENIIHILSEEIIVNDHKIRATVSIGIATYPFASDTIGGIFKAADIALYRAKEKGKNAFQYYSDELNALYVKRMALEDVLSSAIKDDAMIISYRPRLNLKKHEVVALEVFISWKVDALKNSPLSELLDSAEELGFISSLREYFIEKILKECGVIHKKYPELKFTLPAILSDHYFLNMEFLQFFQQQMTACAINPKNLEFVLTHEIIDLEKEQLDPLFECLGQLDITFLLDHFLDIFSYFPRIQSLSLAGIKIHKDVIDKLEIKDDYSFLEAIALLAKNLDLCFMLDNVTTEKTIELSEKSGVQEISGPCYPILSSVPALEDFISKNHRKGN